MKVRGGRPGLPVPNSPHGFCGRKATSEKEESSSVDLIKSDTDLLTKLAVTAVDSVRTVAVVVVVELMLNVLRCHLTY